MVCISLPLTHLLTHVLPSTWLCVVSNEPMLRHTQGRKSWHLGCLVVCSDLPSPPAAGFISDMCGTNLSRLLHVEFTV